MVSGDTPLILDHGIYAPAGKAVEGLRSAEAPLSPAGIRLRVLADGGSTVAQLGLSRVDEIGPHIFWTAVVIEDEPNLATGRRGERPG